MDYLDWWSKYFSSINNENEKIKNEKPDLDDEDLVENDLTNEDSDSSSIRKLRKKIDKKNSLAILRKKSKDQI